MLDVLCVYDTGQTVVILTSHETYVVVCHRLEDAKRPVRVRKSVFSQFVNLTFLDSR